MELLFEATGTPEAFQLARQKFRDFVRFIRSNELGESGSKLLAITKRVLQ